MKSIQEEGASESSGNSSFGGDHPTTSRRPSGLQPKLIRTPDSRELFADQSTGGLIRRIKSLEKSQDKLETRVNSLEVSRLQAQKARNIRQTKETEFQLRRLNQKSFKRPRVENPSLH